MITNVQSSLNSPYVSLSSTGSDQVCEDVPAAINGVFSVDYHGHYASQSAFNPALDIFELIVPGVLLSESAYKALLAKFAADFEKVGTRSAARTIPWNLAAWSSLYSVDYETMIKFTPVTKPHRYFKTVTAVNSYPRSKAGICLTGKTILDFETNALVDITGTIYESLNIDLEYAFLKSKGEGMSFDYAIYITRAGNYNPEVGDFSYVYNEAYPGPCPDQFRPGSTFRYRGQGHLLGVDPNSENPYSMTFTYDTTSTLIATAVNMGIIPISLLMSVLGTSIEEMAGGINAKFYVHPYHKEMFPILCMTAGSTYESTDGTTKTMPSDFCAVVSGTAEYTYFYPFITAVTFENKLCSCEAVDEDRDACLDGIMRMSMIYSIDGTAKGTLDVAAVMGNLMKSDPIDGDKQQQVLVDALYSSCLESTGAASNAACQAAWDAAAGPGADNVGMFTYSIYPDNYINYFTSGALIFADLLKSKDRSEGEKVCRNTIYNAAGFTTMQADVPVPIKQAYYSCTTTLFNAVKSEIGNSYGFVMLFVNIFCLTCLILIFVLDREGKDHKKFVRADGEEDVMSKVSQVPQSDADVNNSL